MNKSLEQLSFLTLFNALADAMLLVDDAAIVVSANTSAQTMLAYPAGALTGLPLGQLTPQQPIDLSEDSVTTGLIDGRQYFLMGNGKTMPVAMHSTPIVINTKTFALITLHAVNQAIVDKAAFKAREERLLFAKESTKLGIFDINLTRQTVMYDTLIGQMFGFSEHEDITYAAFFDAIDVVDQPQWNATLAQAINADAAYNEFQIELRVNQTQCQSQHWLHVAGKVFFDAGVANRVLGIAQDVTERKSLQQKLNKQRIELEALSKTQVAIQTASAIAHEINQPLAAISAYSEVALYALDAQHIDEEKLSRSLTGCVEQAQRAGSSLHELMEFLHEGKIERSSVNLNHAVHEAVEIIQHYDYGGFHPELHLEPDLPDVLAHPTQLQKVLVNLLRNGVEAVHSIGVPIAKIQVQVGTHANTKMAEVTIKDNGPGLTKEMAERVFEPFFTTKSNGVGMGLAISRSLVEACGGQLWFDANHRDGAVFHLTLPFVSQGA